MAIKISLGPISYFWERKKVFEFYRGLINSPVDIIYLGETVCSKRRELSLEDWLVIGRQLNEAGKEVVLSTLTLIEAVSELTYQNRLINESEFKIEANDIAAINQLNENRPFVLGPHINVYNSNTLKFFSNIGACRWVIPVELGRRTIEGILQEKPVGIETELFVFGNLPLAFSARCYTARAYNRPKDSCQFICKDYSAGLPMFTQGKEPFLVLNGIQTQSAVKQNLITMIADIQDIGIDVIRIMPQVEHTNGIIDIFYDALNETISAEAAFEKLTPFLPYGPCNGYWYGKEGMSWINEKET